MFGVLRRIPYGLLVCEDSEASADVQHLVAEVQALCLRTPKTRWAVGFDHRPGSAELAVRLAQTLVSRGATVLLATGASPVAGAALQITEGRADAALVATVLSEPPGCLGVVWVGVESELVGSPADVGEALPTPPGPDDRQRLKERDFRGDLLRFYRQSLPVHALRRAQLQVLVDANGGVADRLLEEALQGNVARVATIYGLPIGTFYNRPVLPQPGDLFELSLQVERGKWQLGVGLSGGADCLFAVDEEGRWVDLGDLQLLLLEAALQRGLAGKVCLGLGVTSRAEYLLDQWGVPTQRLEGTVWHVAGKMKESECSVAIGEFGQLLSQAMPVPDSVYSALWLLEALAERRVRLSEWVDGLHQRYGSASLRWQRLEAEHQRMLPLLDQERIPVGGEETLERVVKNEFGGDVVEVKWESGASQSWLLLVHSGGYAKLLAEAPDPELAQVILDAAVSSVA